MDIAIESGGEDIRPISTTKLTKTALKTVLSDIK